MWCTAGRVTEGLRQVISRFNDFFFCVCVSFMASLAKLQELFVSEYYVFLFLFRVFLLLVKSKGVTIYICLQGLKDYCFKVHIFLLDFPCLFLPYDFN